ncbi:glycosyltransferase family 2 protein [Flavobacterium ovatum]|uniref:glycosyltransferase family 2 protein n=1 Tax=Flavobacterium ovatum TaxID=1928857 RepID=UPI00344B0A95
MSPKVSIIVATYNRANFIVEALQSIQSQVFNDWECIIIDDGGTDNTIEVLTPILQKDNRFRYFKRTDNYQKGLPGSRNYGLDLAQGDYIIFFDDDDIAHPQNLELCVHELADPAISFCRYIRNVFTGDFDYTIFDFSKSYTSFDIGKKDIYRILTNELQFNSCAVMWKKVCFVENKFEESLMYAEEWELYSRIITSGFKGVSISKTLFYGRKHPNSNTGEFYQNNPTRRSSFAMAIILVVSDLERKRILSKLILRYFITRSIEFKEYDLFCRIITELKISLLEKLKWYFFYMLLPLRLIIYRIKKRINRKKT